MKPMPFNSIRLLSGFSLMVLAYALMLYDLWPYGIRMIIITIGLLLIFREARRFF